MPRSSQMSLSRVGLPLLLLLGLASSAGPAAADADSPTVVPASGGGGVPLVNGGVVDVDAIGYDTAEFFVSGDAQAYTTAQPLTPDSPASSALSSGVPAPVPTLIRDDLVPVIAFQAELDVANSGLLLRQPETRRGKYRLWEVTGTGHFDHYGLNLGPVDLGDGQAEVDNLTAMRDPTDMPNPPGVPVPGLFQCATGINTGPMHWVFSAAVHWIDRWVRTQGRRAPPIAPRLQALTPPGVSPVEFAVDEHGIALGGIRTPYVDVPIATLAGVGNGAAPGAPPLSVFCGAFGVTVPFSDEKLAELYPTHASFVWRSFFASLEAVHSRFLLWPDARALLRAAAQSDIGD